MSNFVNNYWKFLESTGISKLLEKWFGAKTDLISQATNKSDEKFFKENYEPSNNFTYNLTNDFSKILGEIPNAIKDYLGVTQREHLNKADELAQQTQAFNESFSKQQLQQQAEQFAIDNATANKNIDFQKQIAENNLALQTDVFNAQLRENELTRQREDTAMQRQVADLQAAGLSPLMVSNGASASGLQVGSAPQYDSSAVATAQGSAISMAREYAQLKNMAEGQYLTRKQAAMNERIGAQMALSQLGAQNKLNNQSLALQSFNLATSLRDQKKKHELIDEQIRVSKNTNAWMEKYGYRNKDMLSTLMPVLEKISENLNFDTEDIANAISNGINTLSDKIKDLTVNKPDRTVLSNESQKLVEKFTDDELQELTLLASLNINFNRDEINQLTDLIMKNINPQKYKGSRLQMHDLIKVNGLKYVLNKYFEMGL